MALYLAVRDSRLEGMVITMRQCARCATVLRHESGSICALCVGELQRHYLAAQPLKPQWMKRQVIGGLLLALGAWVFFLLLVLSTVSVWR